jgi:hypothetical protein
MGLQEKESTEKALSTVQTRRLLISQRLVGTLERTALHLYQVNEQEGELTSSLPPLSLTGISRRGCFHRSLETLVKMVF